MRILFFALEAVNFFVAAILLFGVGWGLPQILRAARPPPPPINLTTNCQQNNALCQMQAAEGVLHNVRYERAKAPGFCGGGEGAICWRA